MPNSEEPRAAVTRATQAEVAEVAILFDEYRMFYQQKTDLKGAHDFLLQRIKLNESVILLARQKNKAVGFVQMYPTFSSVAMQRVWILNDLYVSPDVRRMGAGFALLNEAHNHAVDTGAARLVLATAKENKLARKLYSKANWQEDQAFVHYQRDV